MVTVIGGIAAFATADTAFSPSSIALITIGYLASSIVALVGWLLVRAPWGRWSLIGATAGAMALASTLDQMGVLVIYVVGAAGIVTLSGPWLTLWARQYSPPGGANRIALILIVASPLSPLVVGLAAYDTSHWAHWLAAVTGVVGSWAFGRGLPMAIWSLRVAVPATGVAAILTSPMPSATLLIAGVGLVTVLAWLPGATQTSTFPNPPLPTPRTQRQETSDASD
jgi:hypothetical protein